MKRIVIITFALLLMPKMGFSASVAPSVVELTAQQGETVETTISVINTRQTEQVYYLDVIEFIARDDGGQPTFLADSDSEHLQWFDLPGSSVSVPANSRGELDVGIRVPDDVPAGGYYAAVTLSVAPEEIVSTNGAIIEAKTAVLVLLTVEGETHESLQLLDFISDMEGGLQATPEASFSYRVQNQGNVHVTPEGQVIVRDVFGRDVATADANPSGGRILPASTRVYEADVRWDTGTSWYALVNEQAQNFVIGPVNAQLDVGYGTSGESITSSITYWVFPWQLLLTILVAAAILLIVYKLGAHASGRKKNI